MVYLLINNKIKINVTNTNKIELNSIINALNNNFDIKLIRR